MNTAAAYQQLLKELPRFHGSENAVNWKLENAVLLWLRDNIRQDAYTLETGCGYSTVLFAAGGSRHIVVSPTPKEHERIRQWCGEAGITTKTIHFIAGSSDKVLPSLSHQGQLDLVLIDGCHAFPYPVLDWFYVAERIRIGGVVVVDDTHIRACDDLARFLLTEKTRWKSVAKFGTTAIFQKVASPAVDGVEWIMQPYCQNPRKPLLIHVAENAAKYIAQATGWSPAVYNRLRSVYRKWRDM